MEIIKAARTFAAQCEEEAYQRRQTKLAALRQDCEQLAEALREIGQVIKTGFNPDEPRVPAGRPDGGQWTGDDGGTGASVSGEVLADPPGAQYAANDPPGIGHNQGPPLEEPPEIPPEEPATTRAIYIFLRAAAYWLEEAALAGEPVGDFILALGAVSWLSKYLPYIFAYLDPPKTLEELQQDASSPDVGYNIHHIVEQTSAAQDGFPQSMIDAPDNLVRIPTLKHWLISAWYSTQNDEFDGLSPRDYLRGKSWDERMRVGEYALILFGVLQP